MNKPVQPPQEPKLLLDPYLAWAENEGVPISEDFGIDLLKVPVAHWPRMGTDGGIVHLKGRGDFIAMFVLDLPEGGKSDPQKHIYEEVVRCPATAHHDRNEEAASTVSSGDRRASSPCR